MSCSFLSYDTGILLPRQHDLRNVFCGCQLRPFTRLLSPEHWCIGISLNELGERFDVEAAPIDEGIGWPYWTDSVKMKIVWPGFLSLLLLFPIMRQLTLLGWDKLHWMGFAVQDPRACGYATRRIAATGVVYFLVLLWVLKQQCRRFRATLWVSKYVTSVL